MPGDLPHESTPYDVLEVRADASSRDIARAYRRLARAWHPDAQPVDAGAPARFQAVSDAYELLSDPERRAAYDELRAARAAGAAGSGPVGRAAADRRRRPAPPAPFRSSPPAPFRSSPPPLWPLGPATTAPLASRPHGERAEPPVRPGAPPVRPGPVRPGPVRPGPVRPGPVRPGPVRPGPVRPGPVRIEPLPGDPVVGQAKAEAQLLALTVIVRAFLGDDRNRPW